MAPNPPGSGVDSIARTAARKERIVVDEAAFPVDRPVTATQIRVKIREGEDLGKRIQALMMNAQAFDTKKELSARRGGLTRRAIKSLVARLRRKTKPVHPMGVMAAHVDQSGRVKNNSLAVL